MYIVTNANVLKSLNGGLEDIAEFGIFILKC